MAVEWMGHNAFKSSFDMVGCGDVRVILKTVLIGCEDDLEVK